MSIKPSVAIFLGHLSREVAFVSASQVVLVVNNLSANAKEGDVRDVGLIPVSGRSPGEGNGNPLSILAWKIPRTEDPGGLQSIALHRVRQ